MLISSSTEKVESAAAENDVDHGISYEEFHDGAASDACLGVVRGSLVDHATRTVRVVKGTPNGHLVVVRRH